MFYNKKQNWKTKNPVSWQVKGKYMEKLKYLFAQTVKNLSAMGRPRFNPWVGKIHLRREWQLTPVFLPGKSHGQRSLAGYSQWGCKELDMIE